jgi:carbon storage regulator CsrA
MLVLSRKLNEKIVFPTLNATVQVVEIKRGAVRLGIDAPPEVTIRRAELPDRTAEWATGTTGRKGRTGDGAEPEGLRRQLCGRLATAGVGLGLLRLQLDAGLTEEARATLARLQDDLQLLRYGLEGETDAPPARPLPWARRPQKALLVEDNRSERELLAGYLRESGLEVHTAGDGSDALDYLGSHGRPDVILLDMGLPRVDGPTVVREIRRNHAYAGLKIFGVTAHLPEEFDLECGPRGIDRWFQKPVDPGVLLHGLTEELCGV